ncbi:MAG: diaminopimelate decarboxylase [Omnitrophica bacterium]|nr:diaminopimelate decarboxylase [Candidatus Omnitrophota bacterium]
MHYFTFKRGSLYCENSKVESLAKRFGTPLYIYSQRTMYEHFSKLKNAFKEINPLICYSVKASSNLSILKLLVGYGAGLDIVSGGELYRARKVKCPVKKIVYASVGKTDEELRCAINFGILMFNVESISELRKINAVARKLKKKVDVALRFNPDVEPNTHSYITTGKKETKFGMDKETLKNIFFGAGVYSNLNIVGIHIHIGSQLTDSKPFIETLNKVKNLIKDLEQKGVSLEYLNIGGGLGIVYDKERPQTAQEFADKILPSLRSISLKVILEPGRFIVGNAGILVAKVIYIKDTPAKRFIIVDAAMNDLARPALYSAYHKIVSLKEKAASASAFKIAADIVGPVCESGDFLGKNRHLDVGEGDYIAVLGAGAYGFSMSSNYNSRPRAAEILVKNTKAVLIRKRESYSDLVKGEMLLR